MASGRAHGSPFFIGAGGHLEAQGRGERRSSPRWPRFVHGGADRDFAPPAQMRWESNGRPDAFHGIGNFDSHFIERSTPCRKETEEDRSWKRRRAIRRRCIPRCRPEPPPGSISLYVSYTQFLFIRLARGRPNRHTSIRFSEFSTVVRSRSARSARKWIITHELTLRSLPHNAEGAS